MDLHATDWCTTQPALTTHDVSANASITSHSQLSRTWSPRYHDANYRHHHSACRHHYQPTRPFDWLYLGWYVVFMGDHLAYRLWGHRAQDCWWTDFWRYSYFPRRGISDCIYRQSFSISDRRRWESNARRPRCQKSR